MITCLILAYNEARRIRLALGHAQQWADEVLVVDKSSTDGTAEIAAAAGARVERVPFSRAGHEDSMAIVQMARHDWIWIFTAGEVPTRGVIESGTFWVGSDWDGVVVPHLYYSFGDHVETSPWSWSGQLRLFHRGRAVVQNVVHATIACRPGRAAVVPAGPASYVLHQTHATADGFMASHCDYMAAEARQQDPVITLQRAVATARSYDAAFAQEPKLMKQHLAWKIYWYGVALHALERSEGRDVRGEYGERAKGLLEREWGGNIEHPTAHSP